MIQQKNFLGCTEKNPRLSSGKITIVYCGEKKLKTYTNSKDISVRAGRNRQLLIRVMTKAGFVNYPTEWWHWSYEDRYWAAASKKKFSLYKGK